MKNLISMEDTQAVVDLSTIIEFSGHKEKSLKDIILANEDDLMSMQLAEKSPTSTNLKLPRSVSGTNVKWSSVVFDEKQATYLLTLLGNTKAVKAFKKSLVNQFFDMRETISKIKEQALIEANSIREQDLLKAFKEEKRLAVIDAKKLNDYGGFISVKKYVAEFAGKGVSKDDVWDALEFMGHSTSVEKVVTYRRLTPNCNELVGSTIQGTTGTPVFTEVAINQALKKHAEYLEAEEEEEYDEQA